MKTTIRSLAAASAATVISNTALAHPGHDHSALSAGLIHALFYGAIAAVGAMAVYLAVRHIRSRKQKQDKR